MGEIAALLELRQPQATKHLQTLQRAGLVTMHPLGQRRIYALHREPLRKLRRWLERFEIDHPSEDVLEQYRRALESEQRQPDLGASRTLAFERVLPAPPAAVWRSWTSADAVRRWWSPAPPRKALSFELAPLDEDGVALFSAVHDVQLARHGTGTKLSLTIRVTDARPAAAPPLAGMHLGWNQLLDKLAEHLANAGEDLAALQAPVDASRRR